MWCLKRLSEDLIRWSFAAIIAWKVSKYGVFSGPYFPAFELNTENTDLKKTPYFDTFHAVNKWRLLNIVAKLFILDICGAPGKVCLKVPDNTRKTCIVFFFTCSRNKKFSYSQFFLYRGVVWLIGLSYLDFKLTTAKKMFSIKIFGSKWEQICGFPRIC